MAKIEEVALAYLLGAYLSDGSMKKTSSGSFTPRWKVTDKPFLGCIEAALNLVGIRYSERLARPAGWRKEQGWRMTRFCKELWEVSTLQPEANKLGERFDAVSPDKECLPSVPRHLVRPLVAGLMDGDGSIKRARCSNLRFTGSEGFVHDFKNLLADENISVGKDQIKNKTHEEWKTCYQWTINIEDFLAAGLNFTMPRKQDRLAHWCFRIIKSSRPNPRKISIAKWWLYAVYSSLMPCVSEDRPVADGRYYVARLADRRTFQEACSGAYGTWIENRTEFQLRL